MVLSIISLLISIGGLLYFIHSYHEKVRNRSDNDMDGMHIDKTQIKNAIIKIVAFALFTIITLLNLFGAI